MEIRFLLRASRRIECRSLRKLHVSTRLSSSNTSSSSKSFTQQANPIGDYYASILSFDYTPPKEASIPTKPTSSSSSQLFETKPASSNETPAILFSSRLSSPLERHSEIQKKSVLVAGIWVPPRPSEPDDCCMSGCVNCVWDRYGEEVETWATAKKQADAALKKEKALESGRKKRKQAVAGTGLILGEVEKGATHTAVSVDDDGGGSDSNWGTGLETDFTNDDLFQGVPVGIREFMKQEKKLKEKRASSGMSGG